MDRLLGKGILLINLIFGLILSGLNYRMIYQDIRRPLMQCIIWSVLIIILYALILYADALILIRLFYLFKYRKTKTKYMNGITFLHQWIWLITAMLFIYGLCYVKSFYIGLIPIFLFFHRNMITSGRFYIYADGNFILLDDRSKEYVITSIDAVDNSMVVQGKGGLYSRNMASERKLRKKEMAFLEFCNKHLDDSKDVA